MAAAVPGDGEFAALQSLLKAPSKDAVRQLCQECFSGPAAGLGPLALRACPGLALSPEEAQQLVSALHSLTRHVVYRGLARAEEILALFPENFHQNLKNLLTKIILENISAWRNEAQASQSPGGCCLMWEQPCGLCSDCGAEQGDPGHYVGGPGEDPGPALCRCQQMNAGSAAGRRRRGSILHLQLSAVSAQCTTFPGLPWC
ncbi:COMM domain-containing protein 9 isoform X1 [Melanerpes formicivorus]|uniref:COMM domain-containing protein 9 isoform X1 n=1 Tax=Melanerpes formicivorus TaxID=211600 RepID=UPI00358E6563